ncbi:MAG: hypothetical protein GX483_03150 [Actinomycetaceae bacterium]|nr:hypothetical protein [Actinomycetaceae bacterium]
MQSVDKLLDPLGAQTWLYIVAGILVVTLIAWLIIRIWDYQRPRQSAAPAPIFLPASTLSDRERWIRQLASAVERAGGSERTAHLLLAAELRRIISERIGQDATSWSADQLRAISPSIVPAANLITSWEHPTFSFDGSGDVAAATQHAISVVSRWS